MQLSKRGLDLIYEFEGRLTLLPDGRYQAYRCPANVWTIYAGCTEGVSRGMIVSEAEGETMFRRELANFERCVTLACTREPNQYQFDAFVALAYNIGEAGFRKSSVLRLFNSGKTEAAAKAFSLWNKGGGRVLRGLVRRRAAEAALFLTPVEPITTPEMPQKVDEPTVLSAGAKAGITGGGIFGAGILSDPVGLTSTLVSVKGNAVQLVPAGGLSMWIVPILILAAFGAAAWFLGRKA